MRQWTTPTNTFDTDIDLTNAEVIFITYKQNGHTIFEKTKEDMEITAESISVKLTQKETGLLDHDIPVRIQIRARFADGSAPGSNIMVVSVEEALKTGEI